MFTHTTTEEFALIETRPAVSRRTLLLCGYYGILLFVLVLGVSYGYIFSEIFFPGDKTPWVEAVMNILKLSWLIPLPYGLVNFYAYLRHPVKFDPQAPSITRSLRVKMVFRIITRGHNPHLVAESVQRAYHVLATQLRPSDWCIEVVSDHPLALDEHNGQVRLIVVPEDYQPANGAKYKARGLQYALEVSEVGDEDWIIHLDEETAFDQNTVRAIHRFIYKQRRQIALGEQQYPKIGQGVIVYGKGQVQNWLTTLADSIRVGDDFRRFRLQFEHGKAWFGMHGSFIVVNNAIERQIGFDHGAGSSITEDSYFALVAQAAGIQFDFIHAYMYEKSPFTLKDFIQQRRRWFGGIWFCALTPTLPLKDRAILAVFMLMWSLGWTCPVMVVINLIYPTGTPLWLGIGGGIAFAFTVWMYVVGFICTYDQAELKERYFFLLAAQILLVPLFSVMESVAVLYSLFFPPKDFYIVQKEA
jgi:beta-1,4-mannosyltransferase